MHLLWKCIGAAPCFVLARWELGKVSLTSVENPFAFVLGNLVWHAGEIHHLGGAQIYYGLLCMIIYYGVLSAKIIRQPLS